MTMGEKIAKLRKGSNLTQEQLADLMGVSRQAISKWESDAAYPETDKLIRLGEMFHCSLDYLIKDAPEPAAPRSDDRSGAHLHFHAPLERKSEKTVWGMPLWHVGRNARGVFAVGLRARGIVAVGVMARGVVSLGVLSLGVVSFGTVAVGLLSAGLFALGALVAGCIAAGILAVGAISHGVFALGAIAKGAFSVGALADARYAALGDYARAMVALGDSEALGSVYQHLGELTPQAVEEALRHLDEVTPEYLTWAKELMKRIICG